MKLYNFPIRRLPYRLVEEFQPIDLDYIVSIGQVNVMSYSGHSIGESYAYFTIYIKIGNSFQINHYSGTYTECEQIVIDTLKQDRLDLIKAWEETTTQSESNMIEKLHSDIYNGYDIKKIGNAVNILIETHNLEQSVLKKTTICQFCNDTGKIKTALGGSVPCPSNSCDKRLYEKNK